MKLHWNSIGKKIIIYNGYQKKIKMTQILDAQLIPIHDYANLILEYVIGKPGGSIEPII